VGREQSEGKGARVVRTIGSSIDYWDPFLLLDEFTVSPPAGFPDHPHRGFQTVTYMISGAFKHSDNKGNRGVIKPGEVQWMTAGKGIIHSELPVEPNSHGMQLWVNLPKKAKMVEPTYQDLTAKNMVHKQVNDDVHVTVIAGKSKTTGLESILKLHQELYYLDIVMTKSGATYSDVIPSKFKGFFYVLGGSGKLVGTDAKSPFEHKYCLLFDTSKNGQDQEFEWEAVEASKEKPFRVIAVAGEPLNEPMARYGPFVMNTDEEIRQAFADFNSGKF
jgi:redox-sensitive bicupin YhaK (pirin superfamily)